MSSGLFDLTGRTALVTGSSRGIGYALARGLGQAGAQVVLNGRDEARLREAAGRLTGEGLALHVARFDVTDESAVNDAVSEIESAIAPIDILVNNAGMQLRMPLQDFSTADWRRLMDQNLTSAFLVGRAVATRMLTRHAGKIINVCSLQSELARPTIAPYAASKGALKMLTRGHVRRLGPARNLRERDRSGLLRHRSVPAAARGCGVRRVDSQPYARRPLGRGRRARRRGGVPRRAGVGLRPRSDHLRRRWRVSRRSEAARRGLPCIGRTRCRPGLAYTRRRHWRRLSYSGGISPDPRAISRVGIVCVCAGEVSPSIRLNRTSQARAPIAAGS